MALNKYTKIILLHLELLTNSLYNGTFQRKLIKLTFKQMLSK